jgi:hypothetical protein
MKKYMLFLAVGILLLSILACGSGSVGAPSVKIINNTRTITFCYLYISPTGNSDWGEDKLQGTQIAPGETYTIDEVDPDTYDLKITDCDGASEITSNAQDLSNPFEWTLTENTPTVKLINNTQNITFCYLYISPAGSGNWGENQMEGTQIAPGESFTVEVEPGTYDLKTTDCTGASELTREAQDLNSPFEWTLIQ